MKKFNKDIEHEYQEFVNDVTTGYWDSECFTEFHYCCGLAEFSCDKFTGALDRLANGFKEAVMFVDRFSKSQDLKDHVKDLQVTCIVAHLATKTLKRPNLDKPIKDPVRFTSDWNFNLWLLQKLGFQFTENLGKNPKSGNYIYEFRKKVNNGKR